MIQTNRATKNTIGVCVSAARCLLVVTLPLCLFSAASNASDDHNADIEFVGSKTCASCHATVYEKWKSSHHRWALTEPSAESVLGDFSGARLSHRSVDHHFFKKEGRFFIRTDGADGSIRDFPVRYVVGKEPLQQYLLELEEGRLQAFDIAWDVKARKWYPLYPKDTSKAGDGFHWTGPYKSWQAQCAVCHQTGFKKNYDAATGHYQSRWSELTVGCESCHGPGAAHVNAAKAKPDQYVDDAHLKANLVRYLDGKKGQLQELNVCATCHSRREAYSGNDTPVGATFSDHHKLAPLMPGLYHADGQVNDEVYVYGSFLQSKMHGEGVKCTNCHDPHSAQIVAPGNDLCAQCHSSAGHDQFPTLAKKDYDTPAHHHHKDGSDGAQCVSCHMPEKNFMIVDPRRDHSFRVPRPDLAVSIGTPNACTICHQEKTAQWAADAVRQWFPNGSSNDPHYGRVFHAFRTKPTQESIDAMLTLASDETKPAIVRASAISELSPHVSETMMDDLETLLGSESSLVRANTVFVFEGSPKEIRQKVLLPLLRDKVRSVRIAVARATIDFALEDFGEDQTAAKNARQEFRRSFDENADIPQKNLQLAGLALTKADAVTAKRYFSKAVAQDPQLIDAWIVLAQLALTNNRQSEAIEILTKATNKNPQSGILFRNLGNTFARIGKLEEAIVALEKANQLTTSLPGLEIDLARALLAANKPVRANTVLRAAIARLGKKVKLMELSISALVKSGNHHEARRVAIELVQLHPGYRPNATIKSLLDR